MDEEYQGKVIAVIKDYKKWISYGSNVDIRQVNISTSIILLENLVREIK